MLTLSYKAVSSLDSFYYSNELELSWDPLEASYKDMWTVNKTIVSLQPEFECSVGDNKGLSKEAFVPYVDLKEDLVQEETLSPIITGEEDIAPLLESDIPSLILEPGTMVN